MCRLDPSTEVEATFDQEWHPQKLSSPLLSTVSIPFILSLPSLHHLLSLLKIPPLFLFPPSMFETNMKLLRVQHDPTMGAQEKVSTGATTRPGAYIMSD